MRKSTLSQIRSAAAMARWGKRADKATACVRIYPRDADKIRRLAEKSRSLPADIVAGLLNGKESQ